MSIQPKAIYIVNADHIKFKLFFCKNKNIHPKIHMEYTGIPYNKNNLGVKKGTKLDESHFKTYSKATVFKTVWH